MKFTQKQIEQIIKEEIASVLSEASYRDIDDAIKDLLGSTPSAGIEEIVEDLPMYGNDSDRQDIEEELEELIEKGEVVMFEDDKDGEIMYKLAYSLEPNDIKAVTMKTSPENLDSFETALVAVIKKLAPNADLLKITTNIADLQATLKSEIAQAHSVQSAGRKFIERLAAMVDKLEN